MARLDREFKNYTARPKKLAVAAGGGGGSLPANQPRDSEGWAHLALQLLETGHAREAAEVFKEANFPNEKQSEFVRQTFIEARLQSILELAAAHHCNAALPAAEGIGDESEGVPFSMYGFAGIVKSARPQYLLGLAQSLCGDAKAARKSFGRAAKNWAAGCDRYGVCGSGYGQARRKSGCPDCGAGWVKRRGHAGATVRARGARARAGAGGGGREQLAEGVGRAGSGCHAAVFVPASAGGEAIASAAPWPGVARHSNGQAGEAESSLQKASDAPGADATLLYLSRLALAGKL